MFERFAKKSRISDQSLCDAIGQIAAGLMDADLGGGLINQRIAHPGKGRSGGFRTILALRTNTFACFLYGFAKNDRANVDPKDLADLHRLAATLLHLSNAQLDRATSDGNLFEVMCDEKALS